MDEIDWRDRMIGIKGTRGIGKTTFLLQYAKEHFDINDRQCLYINMNNFYFQGRGIADFAGEFCRRGGRVLLIDQVFKQPDWSSELRKCYDLYPHLKIVFTGSSVMRLKDENPELNGIVKSYNLRGFSFREFINLMTGNEFQPYSLEEILRDHERIIKQILPKVSPNRYFQDYIHHGFYPFFQEQRNYSENLLKTMNMMTEVDILLVKQIELKYLTKIKKLFYELAEEGPKAPNISKLALDIETSRATVMNYIKYLTDARLLNMIYPVDEDFPKKPSKVMLHNSNLLYAIYPIHVEKQTAMETFFVNSLWKDHKVNQNGHDNYYLVGEDQFTQIPRAADGERYFYCGQHERRGVENQPYKMSTTTLCDLPVGTYVATIRYKAALSCQSLYNNNWATYHEDISLYEGMWPINPAEEMQIVLTAKSTDGLQTFASAIASDRMEGHINYYDRAAGNLGAYSREDIFVEGRPQRQEFMGTGSWKKMWLVFRLDAPAPVTFEITQQLRSSYGTDILLDDLRLLAINEVEEPTQHATSLTNNEEYYILNAATGLYFGGAATSGTRAALITHGQPFKVVGSGSSFSLNSYTYEDASNHYLNDDATGILCVNQGTKNYTIEHVGNGKFTIKDGDDFVRPISSAATTAIVAGKVGTDDLLCKWYFISKTQREQIMLNNTKEPDATFYIPNASFGRGLDTEWNVNRWKNNHYDGNLRYGVNQRDGAHVAEAYHAPFYVKKTVCVPNGTYKFRAQGFYREDVVEGKTRNDYLPEFFINDEQVPFRKRTGTEGDMGSAEVSFLEGDYYSDYVTVVVKNNLVTVGARLDVNESLWCCWDNFELELVSKNNPASSENDDHVTGAINTMKASLGFEGGQWAPYVVTECEDMIEEAIDPKFPYSYDKVDDYFLSLVNEEYVNAIYRGDFSYYHNWDITSNTNYRAPATGWTIDADGVLGLKHDEPDYDDTNNLGLRAPGSHKALMIGSGKTVTYGAATGYKMPLIAGHGYKLTFLYGGWGGTGTITLGAAKEGGAAINLCTDEEHTIPLTSVTTTRADNDENGWQTCTLYFQAPTDGNYTLSFGATGAAAIADLRLFRNIATLEEQTSYLYNMGAEKYLAAGANDITNGDMGTYAILNNAGLDVSIVGAASGVGFYVDTKIYATSDNHYLSNAVDNLRCDEAPATWYAEPAGSVTVRGVSYMSYYLYNARGKYLTFADNQLKLQDYSGAAAQKWVFQSYKQRVQDMKNLARDGSTTIDATFLIPGANFGYRDSRKSAWTVKIAGGDGAFSEANYEKEDGFVWADGVTNTYTSGGTNTQVRYGGFNANYAAEAWHNHIDVYQTLGTKNINSEDITLPYGVYTLTAQCFDGDPGPSSFLYVFDNANRHLPDRIYASDSTAFPRYAPESDGYYFLQANKLTEFDHSISKYFLVDENRCKTTVKAFVFGDSSNGDEVTMNVGVRNFSTDQWMVFDNFQLTYRPFYSDDTQDNNTDEDTEYMRSNLILTNIDEVAPYNDAPFCVPADDQFYVKITDQLENQVRVLGNGNSAKECRDRFLQLRVDSVNYMLLSRVEDPGDALRFYIKNNTVGYSPKLDDGTTNTNGTFLTIKAPYAEKNDPASWEYSWSEASGHACPQSFIVHSVEPVDSAGHRTFQRFYLSYPGPTGEEMYICTGADAGTGATGDYGNSQLRSTSDEAKALVFRMIPQTIGDGNWYFKNLLVNTKVGANGTNSRGLYTVDDNYALAFDNAGTHTINLTVSAAYQFSTIMLPFNMPCPTGVQAYTLSSLEDGVVYLSESKVGGVSYFKANTPYVVYAENGIATTPLADYSAAYNDDTVTEKALTGRVKNDSEVSSTVYIPKGSYVLSVKYDPPVVAFYRITEDNKTKLPVNRAYFTPGLLSPGGAGVTAFRFAFAEEEIEDAVEEPLFGEVEVLGIYDVKGVKLPRLQKGMNILRMSIMSVKILFIIKMD